MSRNTEALDSCIVPSRKRGGPYFGTAASVDRAILHFMLEELRATLQGCEALSVEDLAGIPLRIAGMVDEVVMDREVKV